MEKNRLKKRFLNSICRQTNLLLKKGYTWCNPFFVKTNCKCLSDTLKFNRMGSKLYFGFSQIIC